MTKNNGAVPRPKARTDVAEEWVGKEVFIYDHKNGDEVHVLNSGAALIWLLCDGSRDVESIAGELSEAFEKPDDQVLGEVQQTVEQFEALHLVEAYAPQVERTLR